VGHSKTSEVSSPGKVSGFWNIVAKLLVKNILAQHHDRVPPRAPLATDHWLPVSVSNMTLYDQVLKMFITWKPLVPVFGGLQIQHSLQGLMRSLQFDNL
jgi:hypothetical protein